MPLSHQCSFQLCSAEEPTPADTTNDQGLPQPSQPPATDDTAAPREDNEADTHTDTQAVGAAGEQGEQPQGAESNRDEGATAEPQSPRVTWQSLESQWRRFNYDIMPKACDIQVLIMT